MEDGEIRWKARLVAKGFSQIAGRDYKTTFSSVSKIETIRVFLVLAVELRLCLRQLDVSNAFLNATLKEEIFMTLPDGVTSSKRVMCKLNKSLYGLRQAPRVWNERFDNLVSVIGFERTKCEDCLYINKKTQSFLLVYVDDFIITAPTEADLDEIVNKLSKNIELTSGSLGRFLSMNIKAGPNGFSINQSDYINNLLKKYDMVGANPSKTPLSLGFTSEGSPPMQDHIKHKELVGSLIYLSTCSRPDIAFALGVASRVATPTDAHYTALKRILRYLKGSINLSLIYRRKGKFDLKMFSDADYANDVSRRSISGSLVTLNDFPIFWKSRFQNLMTLSTTEAEFVAGCDTVKQGIDSNKKTVDKVEAHK